ncbi:hypothetical protein KW787_02120 [Candidatus Pacearchaeota archaeon]|nr:hypothetical protein [Candidatus Pacearchaeota archaeon]
MNGGTGTGYANRAPRHYTDPMSKDYKPNSLLQSINLTEILKKEGYKHTYTISDYHALRDWNKFIEDINLRETDFRIVPAEMCAELENSRYHYVFTRPKLK